MHFQSFLCLHPAFQCTIGSEWFTFLFFLLERVDSLLRWMCEEELLNPRKYLNWGGGADGRRHAGVKDACHNLTWRVMFLSQWFSRCHRHFPGPIIPLALLAQDDADGIHHHSETCSFPYTWHKVTF